MIHALTTRASTPLYVELDRPLEELIDQGTLHPGHRLPSVRRMWLQRDVSISTVLHAYTLLENRGYYVAPGSPSEHLNRAWRSRWPSPASSAPTV